MDEDVIVNDDLSLDVERMTQIQGSFGNHQEEYHQEEYHVMNLSSFPILSLASSSVLIRQGNVIHYFMQSLYLQPFNSHLYLLRQKMQRRLLYKQTRK